MFFLCERMCVTQLKSISSSNILRQPHGLNERFKTPHFQPSLQSFCCQWLIKFQLLLYLPREEGNKWGGGWGGRRRRCVCWGEGGKTKHFLLNVEAVFRGRTTRKAHGAVHFLPHPPSYLVLPLSNTSVRKYSWKGGRSPRIPEVWLKAQRSFKVELMWHPSDRLQRFFFLIQIGAN